MPPPDTATHHSVFSWDAGLEYSQAVSVPRDQLVFTSGQGPFDHLGRVVVSDIASQVRLTFANLQQVLQVCDASLSTLVKLTVYLARSQDLAAYQLVRSELLSPPYPASTVVGATVLVPDMLIEMEAVAYATALSPNPHRSAAA